MDMTMFAYSHLQYSFACLFPGTCCVRNMCNELWWKYICLINRMTRLFSPLHCCSEVALNFDMSVKMCPQQPPRNVIPSVATICDQWMSVFFFELCEMWPANELLKESLDVSHATWHSTGLLTFSNMAALRLSTIMIPVAVLVKVPNGCIMCC